MQFPGSQAPVNASASIPHASLSAILSHSRTILSDSPGNESAGLWGETAAIDCLKVAAHPLMILIQVALECGSSVRSQKMSSWTSTSERAAPVLSLILAWINLIYYSPRPRYVLCPANAPQQSSGS